MKANDEAGRIVSCMSTMPGYHGTTTVDVADEICSRFDNWVFCNGHMMDMVFTPITKNTIAFKTVPRP